MFWRSEVHNLLVLKKEKFQKYLLISINLFPNPNFNMCNVHTLQTIGKKR
jgi:hypothetical protein